MHLSCEVAGIKSYRFLFECEDIVVEEFVKFLIGIVDT